MKIPNATKKKLLDGSIDLANDTIRVLLLDDSSSYSFDLDAHEFVDDLDGSSDGDDPTNEFSGTNYSRQDIANQSTLQDNTDDEGVFDGDDVTWSGIDGSNAIQTVVVYRQVGGDDTTPGDDDVIAVLDDANSSDLPLSVNGSDVTLSWDAEGILKAT